MYVYIYIHTYTYTYTHRYIYINAHTNMYMCIGPRPGSNVCSGARANASASRRGDAPKGSRACKRRQGRRCVALCCIALRCVAVCSSV